MRISRIGLLLVALIAQPVLANTETVPYKSALTELRSKLPSDARLINDPGLANWSINGSPQTQMVAADNISGGKAISITVAQAKANPWDISLTAPITEGISAGDTLFLAVQIRASAADNEAQSGVIAASKIEENGGAFTALADTSAQVSDKWTTLYSVGVVSKDYARGQTHITVHLAAARQTIEIGNAYAFNLGPNADQSTLPRLRVTYSGREADAAWRAPAQARIEAIRKGDIAIRVLDANGAAIPNADVHVAMTRHAFHFGSFVGHDITKNDADSQKLRETFPLMFNTATSPLYWQDWGWQSPEMRTRYMASIKYLADNKIPWRGHPFVWAAEAYVPTKLKALAGKPTEYRKFVLDHVTDVSAAVAPFKPTFIDVLNEPRDDKYTIDRIGIDGIAEAFRIARKAVPDARLFVNDYGIISGGGLNTRNVAFYHDYLDRLAKADTPFDGIGMQGHFGAILTDPARVLAIFDDFARHGKAIQITEFDIDTTDEEAQADYTRDILTAAFSHPNFEAFTVWGWWEGDHWRPNGAMLRRDWSPKPNYHAWRKLVFSDWWTDTKLNSDANGIAKLRGFLGNYKAVVTVDGKVKTVEFALPKEGQTVEVRF